MLRDENDVPSISDLLRDCQYGNTSFHLTQPRDNCEWLCNMNLPSPNSTNSRIKKQKEEGYDEDSNDSPVSIQEQPSTSLFKETRRRPWPWLKPSAVSGYNRFLLDFIAFARTHGINNIHMRLCVLDVKVSCMTRQEEVYLLQRVDKSDLDGAPLAIRRLYRKLAVRKKKREYGLSLLDLDSFGYKMGASTRPSKDNDRVLDRFFGDEQECIFEQRLQGYNEPTSVHSPYTNRLLKPFIRRDTCCQPLWLRIMDELCAKANKNDPKWRPTPKSPIDYSYIRPQHIPAINSLCSQFFWPGIDCKYIILDRYTQ